MHTTKITMSLIASLLGLLISFSGVAYPETEPTASDCTALPTIVPELQAEASRAELIQKHDPGKELYLSACAACHGADDWDTPQVQLGFETPPPDFTDCNFATREPDADWIAVAHQGGPVRGLMREP